MDQRENDIKQNIEETRAAMNQKIEKIEGRVHETMEGTRSTLDNMVGGINRMKGTIEETKSVIDNSIDTIKQAVDETVERVRYTAEVIDQVKENPWIMFSSAVLVGYVLGTLNRDQSLDMRRTPEPVKEGFRTDRPAPSRVGS
jgi:ElaB/YqjD/DUF883 family membrane-anchored ribosome-binding protein